jgi:serine-type D-Ala-D-Ala carboxypeptidase/endopeptidase
VNPFNPYASYEIDDLMKFLKEHKLRRAPGKEYEYSNVGLGLLGTALAKRAGKTYEELIIERIAGPLKMNDTTITLSDDQKSRSASGASALGLPAIMWDFPALAGCGAIRSTLDDMLIFLRANLSPEKTPLAKAIALSHKPRFTIRAATDDVPESLEIGLGWHITTHKGKKIVWHNGMTGGFASILLAVPEKQWGVVVLGNTASPEIDKLANGLLLEMLQGKLPAK